LTTTNSSNGWRVERSSVRRIMWALQLQNGHCMETAGSIREMKESTERARREKESSLLEEEGLLSCNGRIRRNRNVHNDDQRRRSCSCSASQTTRFPSGGSATSDRVSRQPTHADVILFVSDRQYRPRRDRKVPSHSLRQGVMIDDGCDSLAEHSAGTAQVHCRFALALADRGRRKFYRQVAYEAALCRYGRSYASPT